MFEMVLGHFVGDYIMQTDWMARNKSKNSVTGWIAAIIHCLTYTIIVCLLMENFDLLWVMLVFLSHFFIDKFSLGVWWLDKIKGMEYSKFLMDDNSEDLVLFTLNKNAPRHIALRGGFNAVIYTITDNTMHIVLMYLSYIIIY